MGENQTVLLNPILEDINININIPTAREFIDLYNEFNSNVNDYQPDRDEISKRLIAPPYSDSKKNAGLEGRSGEQELRQLYINNLIKNTKYKYSIETQTEEKYNFTNKNGKKRSGNIDLTIYSPESKKDALGKLVNIEFKFSSQELERDITKLVFEKINGILYLSLINSDKSTIPNILKKLSNAFSFLKESKDFSKIANDKLVMIFIVVLKKMDIYHEVFDFNRAKDNFNNYCKDFFGESNFPALKISEIKK